MIDAILMTLGLIYVIAFFVCLISQDGLYKSLIWPYRAFKSVYGVYKMLWPSKEVELLTERYQELRGLIAEGKKSHGTYSPYQKELTRVMGRLIELGY